MHPDKAPKLLYELTKDSRRSDRDLARALGFSQPTVTRTRRKLEDEGYILKYTALPDFTKLGFELIAFTFTSWMPKDKDKVNALNEILQNDARAVFVAEGNGFNGKNTAIVTMHKNYTDYSDFISHLRRESKTSDSMDSFIATLTGIKKHLTLASPQKI